MAQFSPTDQKRITFLSLLSSAASALSADEAYPQATEWLEQMEADGFFEEPTGTRPTPAPSRQRSAPSGRQGSSSRSQTRDRDGGSNGGFSGNYKNPDGPPTDRQVAAVMALTSDYTEDEVYEMSKADVGALISDLKG